MRTVTIDERRIAARMKVVDERVRAVPKIRHEPTIPGEGRQAAFSAPTANFGLAPHAVGA
jgi:hypothetical protein